MKLIFNIFIAFILSSAVLFSKDDDEFGKIHGVTIDNISDIDDIAVSLKQFSRLPTARIVFDEWKPASYYKEAILKIHEVSLIMGELLDSYYFKNYSISQYDKRVREYVDAFGTKVDIWEIGNEINGEWLGNTDTVVKKLNSAFRIVKDESKITAVTFYYNSDCYEKPENEMFRWIHDNIPKNMKDSLNYVFVSYYEDDCDELQPDWQRVFDSLHVIFPNSRLGIGECGTKFPERKESYIERYYKMEINTPNYVGGYFWWYFKQDCVPYTKKLWNVLNSIFVKEQ